MFQLLDLLFELHILLIHNSALFQPIGVEPLNFLKSDSLLFDFKLHMVPFLLDVFLPTLRFLYPFQVFSFPSLHIFNDLHQLLLIFFLEAIFPYLSEERGWVNLLLGGILSDDFFVEQGGADVPFEVVCNFTEEINEFLIKLLIIS